MQSSLVKFTATSFIASCLMVCFLCSVPSVITPSTFFAFDVNITVCQCSTTLITGKRLI